MGVRQGDRVVRKSYGGDVVFTIQRMTVREALLKGVEFRLLADAPLSDLAPADAVRPSDQAREAAMKIEGHLRRLAGSGTEPVRRSLAGQSEKQQGSFAFFKVPGRVLHLDGDYAYLQKSLLLYKELRVPAVGYYVQEADMAAALYRLLPQVMPDIIVLTGHDGIVKHRSVNTVHDLSSYKNSRNFVDAVKTARRYERNLDALTVVAGACQSHFEALLEAGANFASSPGRVLIHALDPLYIAVKMAHTSFKETVDMTEIMSHTMSGLEGMGGLESRGSCRTGLPKVIYTAVT